MKKIRSNFYLFNSRFSAVVLILLGINITFNLFPSLAFAVGPGSTSTDAKNGARRGNFTKEPVLLQNGNLVLTNQDITIPGKGLSLDITRTYNSQLTSNVTNWAPENGSGSWSIENMEYSGEGGEVFSKYSYQDATIQASMRTVVPGEFDDEVGTLYFHFQDKWDYYFFLIHADGTLELGKMLYGRPYPLAQVSSIYNPLEWNQIKIVTVAGLIQIYINDNLEIEYTDPNPFLSGRVALVAYNSRAHFDNVSVEDNSAIIQSNDFKEHSNGWMPEGGSGPWQLEGEEYSGENGRSVSEAPSLNTTVSCKIRTINHGQAVDDVGWLNFCYQDENNRYYFYITQDKQLVLGRVKSGIQTIIFQSTNSSYDPLYWNDIKISSVNGNIRVWINERLVIESIDTDPLLEGKVALEARNSHVHFDDTSIRDGSPPLSDDFNFTDLENDTAFGQGWTFVYETKLFEDSSNGSVIIRGADGVKEAYNKNYDASYASPKGIYSALTKTETGYTLREKNGTLYNFDISGNLTSIKDRNDNQIDISYTEINTIKRPQTVTDASGRQINFEYGVNGKISKLTYPAPEIPGYREIIYIYDGNNLIEVDYPSGYKKLYSYYPVTGNLHTYTDSNNYITTYNYSYSDKVLEEIDPEGNITHFYYSDSITDVANARDEYTTYEFEENNNLLISVTDTFYNREFNTWDENHNLITFQDKEGRFTDYEYDNQGNRTKTIKYKNGLLDIITTFTYEPAFNQITSITDPLGHTTQFEYDLVNGNLRKIIDPAPFNYETTMSYDEFGQLRTVTDAKGNITEYEYDQYGNRNKIIEAKGVLNYTTTFTYDILSQLTSTTDANQNPPTNYEYDKAGNLIKTTNSLGHITEYSYDGNGNRLSQIVYHNSQPLITYYEYDWANNLTKQINPDTTFTTYTYDLVNFLHLGIANRLNVTDANLNTTAYEYDSENWLIKVIDPQEAITEYAYDNVGNLVSITDANQNPPTIYEYDELNRLVLVTYPDATQELYDYDNNGNLIAKTKQDGNSIIYSYDGLNRMSLKSYPDTTSVTYEYDALDNLLSVTDPSGAIFYNYNEVNRLNQVVYPSGYSLSYEYDPVGNRTKLIYPDYRFLSYRYDLLNRLTMIKLDGATRIAYYQYDDLSRKKQLQLANKTLTDYSYDDLHRLTSVKNKTTLGNVFSSFDYTYDFTGNRKTMATLQGAHNYTYDMINQLTDVSYPFGPPNQINYQLDAAGNRQVVTQDGQATNYTTNNMNQYLNVGGTNYQYDLNGNLTYDGVNSYTYDYENRLITTITPQSTIHYTYDPFGRRIKNDVDGVITNYTYDADQIIMETDGNNQSIYYYVYGLELDELLLRSSAVTPSNNIYYHYDGLGSVVNLTKKKGELVESYTYDVYGKPSQTSSVGNTRMFTGREYDAETGLYYYRARYYSPVIGRFLQKDPLTWTPSDGRISYKEDIVSNVTNNLLQARGIFNTQLLHSYTYVGSNPVNYIDSLGLSTERMGVRTKWNWWVQEAALPGPYGQPMSEWTNGSPNDWGNIMQYTERAGGAWKWGERAAVGTAVAATAVAVGAGSGLMSNYSFRLGIDPANHTFGSIGRVKHIQMDRWISGVKGSDKNIFRIPLPGLK